MITLYTQQYNSMYETQKLEYEFVAKFVQVVLSFILNVTIKMH